MGTPLVLLGNSVDSRFDLAFGFAPVNERLPRVLCSVVPALFRRGFSLYMYGLFCFSFVRPRAKL